MAAAGCVAVNVCSVGFDARIGTQIDRYRRLPLLSGPRAYLASVVVNLIRGVVKPVGWKCRAFRRWTSR